MRALVISQEVSESMLAYAHGQRFGIKRILIPEVDNLTITENEGYLYIWSWGDDAEKFKYETLAEINLPDSFVQKALSLRQDEQGLIAIFKAIIKRYVPKE